MWAAQGSEGIRNGNNARDRETKETAEEESKREEGYYYRHHHYHHHHCYLLHYRPPPLSLSLFLFSSHSHRLSLSAVPRQITVRAWFRTCISWGAKGREGKGKGRRRDNAAKPTPAHSFLAPPFSHQPSAIARYYCRVARLRRSPPLQLHTRSTAVYHYGGGGRASPYSPSIARAGFKTGGRSARGLYTGTV